MKKIFILFVATVGILVVSLNLLKAQNVAINTDGAAAHSSAMLDIKSTTKGLLAPRMTQAQRDLIKGPAAGLLIYQTDNVKGYYYYTGSAWIQFSTGSATNFWSTNGNNIYNNNTASVGIGTNNPFSKLTVQTSDGYGIIHTNGTIRVGTYVGDGGTNNINMYGGWLGTQTDHPLMFFTNNGNPQMMIKQNGNIGIGVTDPAYKLDIGNRILLRSGSTPNESAGLLLNNTNNSTTIGFIGTANDTKIGFYGYTGAGWGLVMSTTNGNVGIGTLTPADKLTVLSNGNSYGLTHTDGTVTVGSYIGANAGWFGTKSNHNLNFFTNDGNPQMIIRPNGQVSVNGQAASIFLPAFTINNSDILTSGLAIVSNGVQWLIANDYDGVSATRRDLDFYVNGAPKAYVDDDGVWHDFSDISLKDNILLYKSVLGNIKKLEVSTYHYKSNEPGTRSFGLVAQNVAQYFPEIVSEKQVRDGRKLLGIAYGKAGVLAIKAIQEQQVIIEKQQQQIEYLLSELQLIKEKLK